MTGRILEVASPEIGRAEPLLRSMIRQARSKSNFRLKVGSWIDQRVPRAFRLAWRTLDRAILASNARPCFVTTVERNSCSGACLKHPKACTRRWAQTPLQPHESRACVSFHCSQGTECYNCCSMASEPTAQTCPGCGTPVDTTEAEPLARIACPGCGKK